MIYSTSKNFWSYPEILLFLGICVGTHHIIVFYHIFKYSAENEAQIRSFLSSTEQSTLVAMIENGELVLLESIPSNFSSTEFVYLLKSPETEITAENFHNKLQSGSILGKFIFLYSSRAHKTPWRNGSASDSRSEGCVFESRRAHLFILSFSHDFCRYLTNSLFVNVKLVIFGGPDYYRSEKVL